MKYNRKMQSQQFVLGEGRKCSSKCLEIVLNQRQSLKSHAKELKGGLTVI